MTFFPGVAATVRVATADLNGDGIPELIGGTGPGTVNRVVILDGVTRQPFADFHPFELAFTGGVFVVAGDLDGAGRAEIVVTPTSPGASGVDRASPSSTALRSSPARRLTSYLTSTPTSRNYATERMWRRGEINGDGQADLAFGGGPRVRVNSGRQFLESGGERTLDDLPADAQVDNFYAGDPSSRDGVRVYMADSDGGGKTDLHAASGDQSRSEVRLYKSQDLRAKPDPDISQALDPFQEVLWGGVFIG